MSDCGPTYYWATRLLPQKIRNATYVLYAFYRVPDDIVDLAPAKQKEDKLNQWLSDWERSKQKPHKVKSPVLRAAQVIHKKFNIPYKYADAFLKAMKQDLTKSRYNNYQELADYMFGSAAVPGIMMTYLVKPNPDKKTLQQAEDLGLAMQLTNFIRDIKEDIEDRDRIYMPVDEMKRFNITEEDIKKHRYPKTWKSFICFQINRSHDLYKSGFEGLKKLPLHTRFCIKLAAIMYMDYNRQIIKSDFQVFHTTYKLSTSRKFFCLIKTILNLTTPPRCPKQL